ncbi:hypothetical protein BDN72DRAFT_627703 [Pluteus cervinus]|uniref:Uncharacterized protein n=1 Tax=Pluteus cervinus TaxID=181527 RepID=A0ACD3AV23_9AGAR|nr:hypothetical protein BDN72DRAFT_627703 [Pluteus cervinus]
MSALNRTPLAAVSFVDPTTSLLNVRVYYQAPDGSISEASYDQKKGWTYQNPNIVGTGKLNTGVAATSWVDPVKGPQIHVYYLDTNAYIVERVYLGKPGAWGPGTLPAGKYQAAAYSGIGATSYQLASGVQYSYVYYQDTKNAIQELVLTSTSGSWGPGTTIPAAIGTPQTGTVLSATTHFEGKTQYRWVYFQDETLALQEAWFDGGSWQKGGLAAASSNFSFLPITGISTAVWGPSRPFKLQVASVDANNKLSTTGYLSPSGWSKIVELPVSAIPFSEVDIIWVGNTSEPDALRLYFQSQGGAISELSSADGVNWALTATNIIVV